MVARSLFGWRPCRLRGEGVELLDTFVNRGLDQATYTGRILHYLISRYPQQSVPLFGQVTSAALIAFATFVRLMVFAIHLDDQLQRHRRKVGRVEWNLILAPKLLVPASSIAKDLPHVACKLVSAHTLVARKRDRIRVARRLSCTARTPPHRAPLFSPVDLPPHPQPLLRSGPVPSRHSLLQGRRALRHDRRSIGKAPDQTWVHQRSGRGAQEIAGRIPSAGLELTGKGIHVCVNKKCFRAC